PPLPSRPPLFPYTTLFRSVGDRDRVVDIVIADHADDRAEDLVAGGRIAHVGNVEDRWLEEMTRLEMARPLAAGDECRTGLDALRSEEHTSELQSRENLVCR